MDSANEAAPAPAAPAEESITLRVRELSGEEMFFKVKKITKLGKIMDSFAQRKGVPLDTLRFRFDGDLINREDTPKMLEMEENDQIDVVLQQTGGNN
eukprot:gene6399-8810_t